MLLIQYILRVYCSCDCLIESSCRLLFRGSNSGCDLDVDGRDLLGIKSHC